MTTQHIRCKHCDVSTHRDDTDWIVYGEPDRRGIREGICPVCRRDQETAAETATRFWRLAGHPEYVDEMVLRASKPLDQCTDDEVEWILHEMTFDRQVFIRDVWAARIDRDD